MTGRPCATQHCYAQAIALTKQAKNTGKTLHTQTKLAVSATWVRHGGLQDSVIAHLTAA